MQVREAQASDAPAIAAVHVASWQAAYVGLVPDDYLAGLSVEERLGLWEWLLGDGLGPDRPVPSATFVLEADGGAGGGVVGFIHVAASRDPDAVESEVGEVTGFYLRSEAWGQGGGRLLMTEGIEQLRAFGFMRATLWVLAGNDRARRFYEAAGWSADGRVAVDESRGFPMREVRYGIVLA